MQKSTKENIYKHIKKKLRKLLAIKEYIETIMLKMGKMNVLAT